MAPAKKVSSKKRPDKRRSKRPAPRPRAAAPRLRVVTPAAVDTAVASTDVAASRIVLGDVLDQAAAATLHAELLSHRGLDAVIDAGAVRRIGGQCLQVLLSAAATWTRDGAALDVVNTSPDFIAGVRLLGIEPGELASRKPFAGAA